MKQCTTNNNKNENMKMKKTMITALVLGACVSTQLFAQSAKEDTITFALTVQQQSSVSTSAKVANAGNWSDLPKFYHTSSYKLTQADLLRAIGVVRHGDGVSATLGANFYSSKAKLVLVQGELSGFFNINPELRDATYNQPADFTSFLDGTFSTTPNISSTSVDSGEALNVRLATGRHFAEAPEPFAHAGAWPPGHHQPWGQIFVRDPASGLCENVTYFFAITVEECYDCFYLNSFISDTTFTTKTTTTTGSQNGPPCCSIPSSSNTTLLGNGKDRYYMTLTFDNTQNNPYLDPNQVGASYTGYLGLHPFSLTNVVPPQARLDGLKADFLPYSNPISSQLGQPSPYLVRFALNGIVTYTWSLKFINKADVLPDFVGSAGYAANGYGFIKLFCSLLTGSVSISEKILPIGSCCLDQPWYDAWYGIGFDASGNSAQRATPVNVDSSLTYHAFFDEEYEPGEQWGTNPPPPTGAIAD
jgi:hypothetical protein